MFVSAVYERSKIVGACEIEYAGRRGRGPRGSYIAADPTRAGTEEGAGCEVDGGGEQNRMDAKRVYFY